MRIAVVVHAFHKKSLDLILRYLGSLSKKVDIFFTGPTVHELIDHKSSDATTFFPTENIGMDILPFIRVAYERRLWKYDLVVKIHTKNSNSDASVRMMRIYLDSLLNDEALLSIQNSHATTVDRIGMWGPIAFARSVDKLAYGNRQGLRELQRITQLHSTDEKAVFFAGSMFAIRGELLKKLSDSYFSIRGLFNSRTGITSTGEDGSIAHALERFVSYLVRAQAHQIGYLFSKDCTTEGRIHVVPEHILDFRSYKRYFQSGSNDTSLRLENINSYKKYNYSEIVDLSEYALFIDPTGAIGIDPLSHYLTFADYLDIPSHIERNFSSAMYRLERPDVFRAGIPSGYHFLDRGRRERPEIFTEPWRRKVLSKYFRESLTPVLPNKTGELHEQPSVFTSIDCRITYREADPVSKLCAEDIIDLRIDGSKMLRTHLPDLLRTRDLVKLQISHSDYIGARLAIEEFTENAFITADLLEVLAVCHTMQHSWVAALHYWRIYQQTKARGQLIPYFGGSRLIAYDAEYHAPAVFPHAEEEAHPLPLTIGSNNLDQVCIYTSLFGDYDDLPDINCEARDEIKFVAFTDRFRPDADKRWQQIICAPDGVTDNMSAKKFKIRPHIYLKQYKHSLFVDANTVFTGDIALLLTLLLIMGPFVMWRHPMRKDIYMEACAILASGRATPGPILEQITAYSKSGMPHNTGLCEGSFIWRSHTDNDVVSFMEAWWNEINEHTHRDQISLCYLMWKKQYYPALMSDSFGTSRDNKFFYKKPHKAEIQAIAR